MATTTNYSWTTPDDTDLVKDGAAAIRTLGSSVDTTTKNLNPETTLGDIAYRSSTANVNTRLALGTANQILRVNSGATAPEWFTPAIAGGMTLLDTMSLSGSSVTSATFSSAYTQLVIYVTETYASAGGNTFYARFNADTGTNYAYHEAKIGGSVSVDQAGSTDKIHIGETTADSATLRRFNSIITLMRPSDTGQVYIESRTYCFHAFAKQSLTTAIYDNSAAITSFTFFPDSGTFTAGTIYIYGVN
jgi:hypothetical protein